MSTVLIPPSRRSGMRAGPMIPPFSRHRPGRLQRPCPVRHPWEARPPAPQPPSPRRRPGCRAGRLAALLLACTGSGVQAAEITAPATSINGTFRVSWPSGFELWLADADWQVADATARSVLLTNLPPATYRFVLANCAWSSDSELGHVRACRRVTGSEHTVEVSGPVLPGVELRSDHAGTVPYSAQVSGRGGAEIRIPLSTQAGGQQPGLDLALHYDSTRAGDAARDPDEGTLGLGWRLTGVPVIHRCRAGLTRDDRLMFDGSDALCLDGELLQPLSGRAWQTGTGYRMAGRPDVAVVQQGTAAEPWFEVRYADGAVGRFGQTEAARIHGGARREPVSGVLATNPVHRWGLQDLQRPDGSRLTVGYQRFDGYGLLIPQRVSDGDQEVVLEYSRRSAAVTGGGPSALPQQAPLLRQIEMRRHAQPIRTWRLDHGGDGAGRQFLESIQACGHTADGRDAGCLPALRLSWRSLSVADNSYPLVVTELVDGVEARTTFGYGLLADAAHAFGHSETPFGDPGRLPGTRSTSALAVTEFARSDGLRQAGLRRWLYSWRGAPLQSDQGFGYLGFAESREIDAATGLVTYTQRRLDWPLAGRIAEARTFTSVWRAGAREVGRIAHTYATAEPKGGLSYPYRLATVDWQFEAGRPIGATVVQAIPCFRSMARDRCPAGPAQTEAPTGIETVTTVGKTVVAARAAGPVWGDTPVPAIPAAAMLGSRTERVTLVQDDTAWIRGAIAGRSVEHAAPGTPDRVVSEQFEYLPGTRSMIRAVRFPGDAMLEQEVVRDLDGSAGHPPREERWFAANATPRTSQFDGPTDDARQRIGERNPLGHSSWHERDNRFDAVAVRSDADGRLASTERDPFGRVVRQVAADGTEVTTTWESCALADCSAGSHAATALRITTRTRNNGIQTAPAQFAILDVLGRPVAAAIEVETPARRWRISRTGWDMAGRLSYQTRPVIGAAAPVCRRAGSDCTWFTYDQEGRTLRVNRPDGGLTTWNYRGSPGYRTVTMAETIRTPGGPNAKRSILTVHDLLGRVTEVQETPGRNVGEIARYAYDAQGNLTRVMVGGVTVLEQTHDLAGRLVQRDDVSSGSWHFEYDGFGQLLRQRDAAGRVTTHGYDLLGRQTRQTAPDGSTQQWIWDAPQATGQLAERRGPGFREVLGYDAASGLLAVRETRIDGTPGPARVFRSTFIRDQAARVAAREYPNGLRVDIDYSPTGQLQSLASAGQILHAWQARGAFGEVVEEHFADGALETARVHHPATGRLLSTRTGTRADAAAIQDVGLVWRSNGSLATRVTRFADGRTQLRDDFGYDLANRLVRQQTSGAASRTLTFAHDRLGNLTGVDSNVAGDFAVNGFRFRSRTAPYHLAAVQRDGVAQSIRLDANGNLTAQVGARGAVTTLGYDSRGLVERIEQANGNGQTIIDEFRHDPDGARYFSRHQVGGTTDDGVRISWRQGVDYEEVQNPAGSARDIVQRIRVSPVAMLLRQRDARTGVWDTDVLYRHRDHLGSVAVVTDGAGALMAQQSFDPWGSRRNPDGSGRLDAAGLEALQPVIEMVGAEGFTGHEQLDGTGFIHMNGRVYDPVLARFVSPDPLLQAPWLAQGFNRYAYVMGNPLGLVDPSGHCGTETGLQLLPCERFDEHVRVIGSAPVAGGVFVDTSSGRSGTPGFPALHGVAGGAVLSREQLLSLANWMPGQGGAGAAKAASDEADSSGNPSARWLDSSLSRLAGSGMTSLSTTACVGAAFGGCAALSLDAGTGDLSGMVMLGLIPGAGISLGIDRELFGTGHAGTEGFGTAVFVTGGGLGAGGSLGLIQGTDGISGQATMGLGFGLGGGVGVYYAMPMGSLTR